MFIHQYMKKTGIGDQELADKIGRDRTVILRLRRGTTPAPDWETVIRLQDATKGAVGPKDWAASYRAYRTRKGKQ